MSLSPPTPSPLRVLPRLRVTDKRWRCGRPGLKGRQIRNFLPKKEGNCDGNRTRIGNKCFARSWPVARPDIFGPPRRDPAFPSTAFTAGHSGFSCRPRSASLSKCDRPKLFYALQTNIWGVYRLLWVCRVARREFARAWVSVFFFYICWAKDSPERTETFRRKLVNLLLF